MEPLGREQSMDCFWNSIRARICSGIEQRCSRISATSNKHRHPKQSSGCFSRKTSSSVFGLSSSRRFGDRPQSSSSFLLFCSHIQNAMLAREHPIEGFCYGYILGWFGGWFGERWQTSAVSRVPACIRSLPAQALIVVSVLALVIAVAGIGSGAQSHVVWALCYGFLLAWIAGWVGNRWQTRP